MDMTHVSAHSSWSGFAIFNRKAAALLCRAMLVVAIGCCAMKSASAQPIQGSLQWQLEQGQDAELRALTKEFEGRGRPSDPAQNRVYQEQLRAEYARGASEIRQKYFQRDNRAQMIREAEQAYGHKNPDGSCCQRDPRTGKIIGDIENTGSNPKNVRSDVDLNAKTHAAADSLKDTWQKQGNVIQEHPHKYVNATTNTTLWRPCDTPECWAAKRIDLDAWTTEGGLQGTGNAGRIRDPKGYYLDNEKKFIHGQEMVKNGELAEGLKTVAKSVDKPAIYAGMKPVSAADIADPLERKFWDQAERLRNNYADSVEAHIADPTDSVATKAEKVKAWIDQANDRMRTAKRKMFAWGNALDKTRQEVQRSLANARPLDPRNQKLNEQRASPLQDEIDRVRRSNQATQDFNRQQGGVGGEDADLTRKKSLRDAIKEAKARAEQWRRERGGAPDSITKAARELDNRLKSALPRQSFDNQNTWRRQLAALNHEMSAIAPLLEKGFMAAEIYNAGAHLLEYYRHVGAAADPSTPDSVADQHFEAAYAIAKNMAVSGSIGAALGEVMKYMPMVGEVAGPAFVAYATFSGSYSGTRWLLEHTETGQMIDRTAGRAFDAGFNAAEAIEDRVREASGGENTRMREQRETDDLLNSYLRAINQGRVKLRPGVSMGDLVDAVRQFDLAALDRDITERLQRPAQPGTNINAVNSKEPHCIYVLDVSGGSVFIGHPSETKGPACGFWGGGPCRGAGNSPPKILRSVTCKNTKEEITASWCGELSGKRVTPIASTGDGKANVYDGNYWVGLAPNCRNVKVASTQPRSPSGGQGCVVNGKRYEPGATVCILAAPTPSQNGAALNRKQEDDAAKKREEQAAAERDRVVRERADQVQRQQQTARTAAAAECAKQNAELKSFDPGTGRRECTCRSGMLYNLARTSCVTQEASRQEHRGNAAAECTKQNADLKSFNPDTGQRECVCKSGLVYNRAQTICVTQDARRAEANAQCSKEFPNAILKSYTNDNKENCGCAAGMTWGGPGGKSCIAAQQASAPSPAQSPPTSAPAAAAAGPQNCAGKPRWCGGDLKCVSGQWQCRSGFSNMFKPWQIDAACHEYSDRRVCANGARCNPQTMYQGRCTTRCYLDVRIGGGGDICPNGGACFTVAGMASGVPVCFTN